MCYSVSALPQHLLKVRRWHTGTEAFGVLSFCFVSVEAPMGAGAVHAQIHRDSLSREGQHPKRRGRKDKGRDR